MALSPHLFPHPERQVVIDDDVCGLPPERYHQGEPKAKTSGEVKWLRVRLRGLLDAKDEAHQDVPCHNHPKKGLFASQAAQSGSQELLQAVSHLDQARHSKACRKSDKLDRLSVSKRRGASTARRPF